MDEPARDCGLDPLSTLALLDPAIHRHLEQRRAGVSERVLVDWDLAERVALGIAGTDGGRGRTARAGFGKEAVEAACGESVSLVVAYTRLRPRGELPRPEIVGRGEWARAALTTLRELAAELERRAAEALSLPGPLGTVARALAGAATGAEAGAAAGYAARHVLGQYEVSLLGAERPPRLLLVAPNLEAAHAELGEKPASFLRWIALHETTHAVQFAAAPWLRERLGDLISELIETAARGLEGRRLREAIGRLVRTDPRQIWAALLRGGLPEALAGADRAALLGRVQATMSVIEGHAEHVMDAVGEDPAIRRLRERLEQRRSRQTGLEAIVARLLGLDLKLRQYRLGKEFCDAVVRTAGVEGLNRVWAGPHVLPTLAELEAPGDWLARVSSPTR